jgi:hypothetical protein
MSRGRRYGGSSATAGISLSSCARCCAQGCRRARCGFARISNRENPSNWGVKLGCAERAWHWRCATRWRTTAGLSHPLDPLIAPRDQFLVAGDAWQQCRAGRADPQRFGILDMFGLWFIRGNVVRDVAARAKRELLPWDGWGLMTKYDADSDAAELKMLDHAAELTLARDDRLDELLELQATDPGLRLPRKIVSYNLGGASVDLGPGIAN